MKEGAAPARPQLFSFNDTLSTAEGITQDASEEDFLFFLFSDSGTIYRTLDMTWIKETDCSIRLTICVHKHVMCACKLAFCSQKFYFIRILWAQLFWALLCAHKWVFHYTHLWVKMLTRDSKVLLSDHKIWISHQKILISDHKLIISHHKTLISDSKILISHHKLPISDIKILLSDQRNTHFWPQNATFWQKNDNFWTQNTNFWPKKC